MNSDYAEYLLGSSGHIIALAFVEVYELQIFYTYILAEFISRLRNIIYNR